MPNITKSSMVSPSSLVWTTQTFDGGWYGTRMSGHFILLRKTIMEGICFTVILHFPHIFLMRLFSGAKIVKFCLDFYFIFGKTISRLNKRKHFL